MKYTKKQLFTLLIIALVPLAATAICYPLLPDVIPTHWNFAGVADGFGGKNSIFLMPGIMFIVGLMLILLPKVDPRGQNYSKFAGAYKAVNYIVLGLLGGIQLLILFTTISKSKLNMSTLIMFIMGIAFMLMGNFMPKFKPNFFAGIRTPWTLSSETVWAKTHRLSGKTFMLGGAVLFLTGFFKDMWALYVCMAVVISSCVVIPFAYSYILFKKYGPDKPVAEPQDNPAAKPQDNTAEQKGKPDAEKPGGPGAETPANKGDIDSANDAPDAPKN